MWWLPVAADQLAHRAVDRDAVELRLVALERVLALRVRLDAPAQLELALGLHVVDAVGLRLPDVEQRVRHRLAVEREHAAADVDVLALHASRLRAGRAP